MFRIIFITIIRIFTIAVIVLIGAFLALKFTGHEPFIVQSASMEPVIHTGSLVFIDRNDKEVEAGDIITFTIGANEQIETGNGIYKQAEAGKTVTHRLIWIDGDDLYTKGDANNTADLIPVQKSRVVGTYMFQIPEVGFVLGKLGKIFWFALAGIIVLLNIASALLSDGGDDENTKKEPDHRLHTGDTPG